jgi:aspartyl protease family protein
MACCLKVSAGLRAMMKLIGFAAIGAVALSMVPPLLVHLEDNRQASLAPPAAGTAAPVAQPTQQADYLRGRAVTIQSDGQGHFNGSFRINGRSVDGMIDTGATYVAINLSTARRIGAAPPPRDFVHPVSTANGTVKAARVFLDRVELGNIDARNVEAFVLEDASLSTTLIGMSFMRMLSAYRVENGALHLYR